MPRPGDWLGAWSAVRIGRAPPTLTGGHRGSRRIAVASRRRSLTNAAARRRASRRVGQREVCAQHSCRRVVRLGRSMGALPPSSHGVSLRHAVAASGPHGVGASWLRGFAASRLRGSATSQRRGRSASRPLGIGASRNRVLTASRPRNLATSQPRNLATSRLRGLAASRPPASRPHGLTASQLHGFSASRPHGIANPPHRPPQINGRSRAGAAATNDHGDIPGSAAGRLSAGRGSQGLQFGASRSCSPQRPRGCVDTPRIAAVPKAGASRRSSRLAGDDRDPTSASREQRAAGPAPPTPRAQPQPQPTQPPLNPCSTLTTLTPTSATA
jgi:hypothetical protein